MKNYTTKSLKCIAGCYITFPILYLVSCALLFDVPARSLMRLSLSPSFYVISGLAIAAGLGLWEMKRWAWYVFLISNVATGYYTALTAAEFGESHYRVLGFILTVAVQVFFIFRIAVEVKVPYFLPKIRWWESDPRYKLIVPVKIKRNDSTEYDGEILDLSLSGCFIKLKQDLLEDETIQISFSVFKETMSCSGSVVWRTQGAVTHPKGLGLKFTPLSKPEKKLLKGITARLKEMAALYRTSRYLMSQEEFLEKMEELQKSELHKGS